LALTDIDESTLEETVALVAKTGADVISVVGDISALATSTALVAAAVETYGRVDGICNVAGISPAIELSLTTGDDFDQIMGINCKAQLFLIQAALPSLRAAGAGSIVNVSSVGGRVALPHLTVYGASKSAILGLTRGVAYELAGDNIRCNAVCPGGIDSAMADTVVASFPDRDSAIANLTGRQLFKRFADASEIATLMAYLVSDESSFITGATFSADAGHTAI
jgi:NAD(P)-dependent dehydrogenase (short-subunit alcohol dehydrogenase family)